MKSKLTGSIASVSAILAFLTVLSKGFGLLREMIYAKNFGLSLQFDLFLVGSIIPITINSALLYLGQHYFVPEFNAKKSISESEGDYFFSSSFYLFIFGSVLVTLLLYLFSFAIMELFITKSDISNFKIANNIFLLFLITIPFNAGISIISAYLQSKFNFIYPALVQIFMNVIIIILVFTATSLYHIYILPISFIVSYIAGFIILWLTVNKKLQFKIFDFHYLRLSPKQTKNLFSLVIIEGLSLSYVLIDRYYFEYLDAGGVSSLSYAITLYLLPISIISITLSTVIFPKFSQTMANSSQELLLNFRKAIYISIYLMMPITIIFICFGKDFVKIFYERGKFVSANTDMTQAVLIYYSLSLVFYSVYLIIVKLFYSLSKYTTILYLSVAAFFIKIIFNYVLVFHMKQDGLALSTSIVFLFLFGTSALITNKTLKFNQKFIYTKQILLSFVNAVVSVFFTIVLYNVIPVFGLIKFTMTIITFSAVYLINSIILKSEDYDILKNTVINFRSSN